jgi:hypothetical protein
VQDRPVGNLNVIPNTMTSVDLRAEFDNWVDTSAKIEHAYYYISPFGSWQIEDKVCHHA